MHVSNFFLEKPLKIPENKLVTVINNELPGDIVCTHAHRVLDNFNSRRDAKLREYMYVIYNDDLRPPFYKRRSWHVKEKINIRKMKKALSYLVGKHDFASFCASRKEYEHTIRTITKIKVKKKKPFIKIYITGHAFLHKMVRMIVGAALEIAKKNIKAKEMKFVLHNKSRGKNPFGTAPPGGLYLNKIVY